MTYTQNRETWLHAAAEKLRPWLQELGYTFNEKLYIGVGWGGGQKGAGTQTGCCFYREHTASGATHIVVAPSEGDQIALLGTLLHELGHDAVGCSFGHGPKFKKFMMKVGLEGKPTATEVGEGPLRQFLQTVSFELGHFPNEPVVPVKKPKRPPAGGWIKYASESDETYILRLSPKAFKAHGAPMDWEGKEMIAMSDLPEDDGDED